jgi:hypothetical protein
MDETAVQGLRAFYREAIRTRSHWVVLAARDEAWFVDKLLMACSDEVLRQEQWPRPMVQVLDLGVSALHRSGHVCELLFLVASLPRASLPVARLHALLQESYGQGGDSPEALARAQLVVPMRHDRLWAMGVAIEVWQAWLQDA